MKCNGGNDAEVQLFVMGGIAPYSVVRNSTWNAADTLQGWNIATDSIRLFNGELPFVSLNGLTAGNYHFTLWDANGCHSVLGTNSSEAIKVKEPNPLSATIVAPSICANADAALDDMEGGISVTNVKGGTKPYTYEVVSSNDSTSVLTSEEPLINVKGNLNTSFHYTVFDANGCATDTTVRFNETEVEIERVDFMASTWMYAGDIVALIDLSGPDDNVDSVTYTFSSDQVELLDKRMYIYDIAGGPEAALNALYGVDTKTVPDAYFEKNFELAVDPTLAKHINFLRVHDTLGISSAKNPQDSSWLNFSVTMHAYFKGCHYELEKNCMKVAYDSVPVYNGGLAKRHRIQGVTISPNPSIKGEPLILTVKLEVEQKCDVYLYHVNGEDAATRYSITHFDQIQEKDKPLFQGRLVLDSKMLSNYKASEVIIVQVRTTDDVAYLRLLHVQ